MDRPFWRQEAEAPRISVQSANGGRKEVSPAVPNIAVTKCCKYSTVLLSAGVDVPQECCCNKPNVH
jgi:hypothetical protein